MLLQYNRERDRLSNVNRNEEVGNDDVEEDDNVAKPTLSKGR